MKPICKPMVNTQLKRMNGLQRTAESFRYIVLSLEFWISPGGTFREWVRKNTHVALFIAVPTFMALPIATIGLWELSLSLNALTAITGKLIFLPILVLLTLVSISIVLKIIGAFRR